MKVHIEGILPKSIYIILLFIIWISSSLFKIYLFQKGTDFLNGNDFCLFRVEEATRYRYARLVSEGKKIPKIDYDIQYPEGLNVSTRFTTLSERIIGSIYRVFGFKVPFSVFIVIFLSFYSGLSIFVIYLFSLEISKEKMASLIGALFYSFSLPFYIRTVAGGLVEEDFALFPIFLSIYLFFISLRKRKIGLSVISGLIFLLPLGSWHATQFFFTLFIFFIVIEGIMLKKTEFQPQFYAFIFPIFIFGIFYPTLKAGDFSFSYTMLISYSFLMTFLLKNKRLKIVLFAVIFIVLYLIFRPFILLHSKEFSNVYTLIINKIKFLGVKPLLSTDAAKIPFDAKVTWQSSFLSPNLKNIFLYFFYPFLLSLYGIIMTIKKFFRKQTSIMEDTVLYFFFIFVILYILIKRMHIFTVFFLSIFISLSWKHIPKKLNMFRYFVFLPMFLLNLNTSLPFAQKVSHRIPFYEQEVIRWFKDNVKKGSVVLADIGISPSLVTYANVKAVVHNHYESYDIREKTEEFYKSLFLTEKNFFEFCRKNKAHYFLYNWGFLIDSSANSIRYQINARYVKKDSACYLFNFRPKKLHYFSLIFQNNKYRIYKIGKDKRKRYFSYVPFFDERNFISEKKLVLENKEVFDDETAQSKMARIWQMPKILKKAKQYRKTKQYRKALVEYKRNVSIAYYMPQTHFDLGEFLLFLRKYESAIKELKMVIDLDKHFLPAYDLLTVAYCRIGKVDTAKQILRKGLLIEPKNYYLKKRLKEVESGFE